MPDASSLQSPTEQPLVSPASGSGPPLPDGGEDGKVKMKKQLGLIEGVAIILGIIFGSGNNFAIQNSRCR